MTNLELFTLVARNLNDVAGAAIGCYALRLVVRPGLTGWAQVRYRYANNLDEEIEKLRYDLHYVKTHVAVAGVSRLGLRVRASARREDRCRTSSPTKLPRILRWCQSR